MTIRRAFCYRFCYPTPCDEAERDGTAAWLRVRFRPGNIDQVGHDDTGRDGQNWSFSPIRPLQAGQGNCGAINGLGEPPVLGPLCSHQEVPTPYFVVGTADEDGSFQLYMVQVNDETDSAAIIAFLSMKQPLVMHVCGDEPSAAISSRATLIEEKNPEWR